jgi:hypothetical protein
MKVWLMTNKAGNRMYAAAATQEQAENYAISDTFVRARRNLRICDATWWFGGMDLSKVISGRIDVRTSGEVKDALLRRGGVEVKGDDEVAEG